MSQPLDIPNVNAKNNPSTDELESSNENLVLDQAENHVASTSESNTSPEAKESSSSPTEAKEKEPIFTLTTEMFDLLLSDPETIAILESIKSTYNEFSEEAKARILKKADEYSSKMLSKESQAVHHQAYENYIQVLEERAKRAEEYEQLVNGPYAHCREYNRMNFFK